VEGFEWGEEKNKTNQKKHGMPLRAAIPVFEDEYRIEIYDEDNSNYGEDRYITIGYNKVSAILYVIYTMRINDRVRLISARLAEPHEKRLYQQNRGK